MKRTHFILAAAILPFLVLGWMAGEREWVLHTGRTIWLRTAPVDPRDPFRGDYVTLDYEVSTLPKAVRRDGLKDDKAPERGRQLYAVLREDEEGLAELDYATDQRPSGGLFLRGRTEYSWGGDAWRARYGIEAYFVEQGKGKVLEESRTRTGIQVPLEMQVAVGRNGIAVLKGYRWGRLGIGLGFDALPPRPAGATQDWLLTQPLKLTLTLKNVSDQPLAIVDLPGHRAFRLEQSAQSLGTWRWVEADAPRPPLRDDYVKVLAPGAEYGVHFDFSDPAWQVVGEKGERKFLRELDWGPMFRLVYRPPTRAEAAAANLRDAALLWHGYLLSRAFNGRQGMD